MARTRLALTAAALALAPMGLGAQETVSTAVHDYRIVTVAEGLENPWGMAFLPGGDLLVTERPGRLRIIRDGRLLPDPVPGLPEVFAQGQGGLLDILPHPDFAENRLVYLTYSKPLGEDESTTAVIRARFENDRLTGVEEVFEANSRGRGHYGSRLAFDDAGHLFVTVGDRQAPPRGDLESHPAQDPSNHHGTVNRLMADGSIPRDNPFVGEAGYEPSIWSFGPRNPQGLAIDPETGTIWITEHGPQGGDELNRIQPGLNYGWPVVGYGVNYGSGARIHEATMREGMENPVHIWVRSIATSGLMVYTGDAFPEWRGNLFAGGLGGQQVARLVLEDDEVVFEETIFYDGGRVRAVKQGLDGFIYLAIDQRRGGRLYRRGD